MLSNFVERNAAFETIKGKFKRNIENNKVQVPMQRARLSVRT